MEYTYLSDTHTIYVHHNELYLCNDDITIVININNFIHDLPSINTMCKDEYIKSNKELFKRLKHSTK